MSPGMAADVYPIIAAGLALWRTGESADAAHLPPEWGALKDRLRRADANWASARSGAPAQFETEVAGFPGIGFPLACWLDELFILNSVWGPVWNESKLESELYATNDRATKFWQVATAAERHAGVDPAAADVAEVCYLCVALGFRGERVADPEVLTSWWRTTGSKVVAGLGGPQPTPPAQEYPTAVPPRRGPRRLRTTIVLGGVLILLSVAFLVPRLAGVSRP